MNETENILLMFLSTINLKSTPTYYGISANPKGEVTKTTNESAIRYILYKECRGDAKLNKIFIFASNTVREGIVGDSGKTHLQYFKDRIGEFIPNVDDCINDETIYNYDENSSGVQNMIAVAEMAERIQKYSVGKEVTLHVDLTGGMRNVNMMMLDIIRFLEYNGIKIGRLIYSQYQPRENVGYIHEIKNIYDLLQLISGVEEFINFGSVKVLKDYYAICKNPISTRLQNLIDAMENFSEAIKLCRYGQFKDAIKNLHDALNDFKVEPNNLQDTLMARLIGRIRKEYENLIATRGEDDLKIIRWCLENGYLQQALTLYTERVPEYIKNLLEVSKEYFDDVNKKLKGDNRIYGFYLLNNYKDDNYNNEKKDFDMRVNTLNAKNGEYFSSIQKMAIEAVKTENFSYEDLKGKIVIKKDLPVGIKTPNENQLRLQLETLHKIWQNPKLLSNLEAAELLPIKEIIKSLQGIKPSKRFNVLFKNLPNTDLNGKIVSYEGDEKIFRLKHMLEKKILILKISEEKFFSIMTKYFVVKDERNHSNHARPDETGEFETAKDLEEFMKEGLEEIEQC